MGVHRQYFMSLVDHVNGGPCRNIALLCRDNNKTDPRTSGLQAACQYTLWKLLSNLSRQIKLTTLSKFPRGTDIMFYRLPINHSLVKTSQLDIDNFVYKMSKITQYNRCKFISIRYRNI